MVSGVEIAPENLIQYITMTDGEKAVVSERLVMCCFPPFGMLILSPQKHFSRFESYFCEVTMS